MTAKKILENVQGRIRDYINLNAPWAEVASAITVMEWIDREITKAIEDHEAEGE